VEVIHSYSADEPSGGLGEALSCLAGVVACGTKQGAVYVVGTNAYQALAFAIFGENVNIELSLSLAATL